ncbi:hypothetical protein F4810DRAFT_673850 [Camillea tinctor]|nr:hypothetical protein F4810DRAFT_673850 [Camillea tinctor]
MYSSIRSAVSAIGGILISVCLAQEPCDRSCLEDVLSEYFTALTSNDPSRLPTTPDVKYVENDQIIPLGSGLWPIAGSQGKYRHLFADPQSGNVAAITTITENGVQAIYVVRLKVEEDRSISEIETQITRDASGAALYEEMGEPEAVWYEPVPPENRISRERLIEQTNKYYSGMEQNDPHGNYSFFDKDCNRLEDAIQTTNVNSSDPYGHSNDTSFASLGCEAQFQTGFLGFVTRIRARRFPIVDEQRQVVLAVTTLDHNGTVRRLPSVNGTSSPTPPYFDVPRSLLAAEAFRLRGDKLFRIEMALTEVPYGMRSAFPAHGGLGVDLEGALDAVLDALRAHEPARLLLAQRARYSENGQFVALGDGLWETLVELDEGARFVDPLRNTVGFWGYTKEQSTPGVLALGVRVDGEGRIAEIEALGVRAESNGERYGTVTLMRPPLPVEWEGEELGALDGVFLEGKGVEEEELLGLVEAYFDGLEAHSSAGVLFTPDCVRRDNGAQREESCAAQMDGEGEAPNGLFNRTTAVRDRRVLVADSEKSVVLAVALVDAPAIARGEEELPPTERVPSTYMIPQLIKIEGGKIARVESMIKWMPFGYTSTWGEEQEDNGRE